MSRSALFTSRLLAAIGLFSCVQGLWGQSTSLSLAEQMTSALIAAEYNPTALIATGDALWQRHSDTSSCDSLELATYMMLQGAVMLENYAYEPFLDDLKHESGCVMQTGMLAHLAGICEFRKDNLNAARLWFETAVELSEDSPQSYAASAWIALSSTWVLLGEPQHAIDALMMSLELAPEQQNAEGFNNMAELHLELGHCGEALQWCQNGQERVQQAEANGLDASWTTVTSQMLHLTELKVCMALDDQIRARSCFANVEPRNDMFEERKSVGVQILTAYLQWIGDETTALALRPRFDRWVADLNAADKSATLGVNSVLFGAGAPDSQENWLAQWRSLAPLPFDMKGLNIGRCKDPVVQAHSLNAAVAAAGGALWKWIACGALGLAVLVAAAIFSSVPGQQWRMQRRDPAFLMDQIQSAVPKQNQGESVTQIQRRKAAAAFEVLMARSATEAKDLSDELMADWSELERKVALGLAQGKTTKQLATTENLSVQRIYQARRDIRQRLNLRKEVQLDEWLQSNLK